MFEWIKSLKEMLKRNDVELHPLPYPRCGDYLPGPCDFCNGQGIILLDTQELKESHPLGGVE